jgi:hypothetical protein
MVAGQTRLWAGLAFLAGCQSVEPPGPGALGVELAALSPACEPNENGDHAFPTGSDRVVVRISGGAIGTPLTETFPSGSETTTGQIVVKGVPPGSGMTVEVVACKGSEATWEGSSSGVSATAHQKSFPRVFLTPVSKVACTGSAATAASAKDMQSGHAFGAVHADGAGAAVIGGLQSYDAQTRLGAATPAVDVYDASTGAFGAGTPLLEARAGAFSVVAKGAIVLAGGATSMALGKAGKPSIWAEPTDAPACAVALYDLVSGTTTCQVAETWPALPSVALSDTRLVAVGGVGAGSTGASSARVVEPGSGTSTEIALPGPSFGATVVPLQSNRVLVWGGAWDADKARVGVLLDLSSQSATPISAAGSGAPDIPIFAAGISLGQEAGVDSVLLAGGATITSAGQAGQMISTGRLALITLDAAGTATYTPIDPGADAPDFARAAASIVPLETGDLWWVGGTKSFFCQTETDCIPSTVPSFLPAGDGTLSFEAGLAQTVGGLGAGTTQLADGSWLVTAGVGTSTSGGAVGFSIGKRAELVRHSAAAAPLCK